MPSTGFMTRSLQVDVEGDKLCIGQLETEDIAAAAVLLSRAFSGASRGGYGPDDILCDS
jgi:hypothetical protein